MPHEAEAVGVAVVDNYSGVGAAIDAAVGIGVDAVDEALPRCGHAVNLCVYIAELEARDAVVGGYPQRSVVVGGKALDAVVGEFRGAFERIPNLYEIITVVAHQAGGGAYPQKSLAVEVAALTMSDTGSSTLWPTGCAPVGTALSSSARADNVSIANRFKLVMLQS